MDPEEKIPAIPYQTPERIEDPPGGISFYTPAIFPYTDEDEGRVKILFVKMNIARTEQECLLILKLFGCLQNPIDQ